MRTEVVPHESRDDQGLKGTYIYMGGNPASGVTAPATQTVTQTATQTRGPVVMQWWVCVALFLLALGLYLMTASQSLDDFDSISFALALDQYDISLQQPHPPGFPVYIAAARLLYAVIGDRLTALTLLSVLSGAILCATMAWWGMAWVQAHDQALDQAHDAEHQRTTAITGLSIGLLTMVLPAIWLHSIAALSDIPGLACTVLACAWWWQGRQSRNGIIGGAILAALALGIRPQNALPLVIFGVWAAASHLRQGRVGLISVGLAVLAGSVIILLWLLPMVALTGGLERYRELVAAHSAHVYQIDSLVAEPITAARLSARLEAFQLGLLALVGGSPWMGIGVGLVWLIGVIRLWRTRWLWWRSGLIWALIAWSLGGAMQVFIWNSLERPRLYVLFVPPLLLLTAAGWFRPRNRQI